MQFVAVIFIRLILMFKQFNLVLDLFVYSNHKISALFKPNIIVRSCGSEMI